MSFIQEFKAAPKKQQYGLIFNVFMLIMGGTTLGLVVWALID